MVYFYVFMPKTDFSNQTTNGNKRRKDREIKKKYENKYKKFWYSINLVINFLRFSDYNYKILLLLFFEAIIIFYYG